MEQEIEITDRITVAAIKLRPYQRMAPTVTNFEEIRGRIGTSLGLVFQEAPGADMSFEDYDSIQDARERESPEHHQLLAALTERALRTEFIFSEC